MPINDKQYTSPATAGDVAGVALQASIAIDTIALCLERMRAGQPITEEQIQRIRETSMELDKRFERLAGWTEA